MPTPISTKYKLTCPILLINMKHLTCIQLWWLQLPWDLDTLMQEKNRHDISASNNIVLFEVIAHATLIFNILLFLYNQWKR